MSVSIGSPCSLACTILARRREVFRTTYAGARAARGLWPERSGAAARGVVGAAGPIPDAVRQALRADLLNPWCKNPWATIYAVICHHGEPVGEARIAECGAGISAQWTAGAGDDPIAEIAALMDVMLAAFPGAMNDAEPFPDTTRFQHALAGLVMTADWMGSDARWNPVVGPDDRPQAADAVLADTRWSGWHTG